MTLTVVTLNTFLCRMFGFPLSPGIAERLSLLCRELGRLRPDIALLQEVWSGSLVRAIREALPEYAILTPGRVRPRRPLGTGLVIASRHAVRCSSYHPIAMTGRPKEVLASKGLFVAEIELGGPILRIADTHLGIGSRQALRRHHQALLDLLDRLPPIHLLGGDLNQAAAPAVQRDGAGHHHDDFLLDQLGLRGYRDTIAEVHGSAAEQIVTVEAARNPLLSPGYHLRLDYILARSAPPMELRTLDAQLWLSEPIDGTFVSDHYGLKATIEICS